MALRKKDKELSRSAMMQSVYKEFLETKGIDAQALSNVMEESFKSVLAKLFGSDENFKVIVNSTTGDFEIHRKRIVVEDGCVEDANKQVSLSDAVKISPDFEVGEEVDEMLDVEKFGRRNIVNLRQALASKTLELEHQVLENKFNDRVGQIVSGEVYQTWKREALLVDDEGYDLILPKTEQIPGEHYHKGENIRAVIDRVETGNGTPKVIISRTSPTFLQRLLEAEVPEIGDGLISVRKIARIPGRRAKVAVESYDERIDPVGACVGVKGSRVRGIVHELCNENMDVINYTDNEKLFIQRALSPAKVNSINIDPENKKAEVYLAAEEVSLAIGREGMNIKLASMITGYTIDVFRDVPDTAAEEDVELDLFSDEIEQWVIDAIKAVGLTTAKAVIREPRESLAEKTDLEEETIDHVLNVLNAEFEQG